ncbi:hypothetical protein [Mesonia maritima]|uniref:Uncharacterized protein n=1 Tax=Mesonia maritima TaxID=1793873 RepID=A0ABU1K8I3_9FLAO|nr:hypothetical protein [Mesonia maritima]MDR6301913.1 hypothetical protein [Mesonia maritima]
MALISQNFYRKCWLTFIIAIGLPLGVVVAGSLNNMSFSGIGFSV